MTDNERLRVMKCICDLSLGLVALGIAAMDIPPEFRGDTMRLAGELSDELALISQRILKP